MADPIYVVTLKKKEDLDGFYSDMASDGYKIHMKRPISRNTQYYMTDAQAVTLRSDSRVMYVEKRPQDLGIVAKPKALINTSPHGMAGTFRKSSTYAQDDLDWGKLHAGGTDAQRRKTVFGWDGTKFVTDNIDIFNDGRHVDVVVCDTPVSFDCAEWISTTVNPGQTRFVQYEWYNELNSFVSSIDDDSRTLPTGTYPNYVANAANTKSHGTHCCGTIAGKHYGWAPEANIYSLQCLTGPPGTAAVDALLLFDYLRAFHKNKAINPTTGKRNPTVTSHSWGYGYDFSGDFPSGWAIENIDQVRYRGNVYNPSSPNPSGWTMEGLEADVGFGQWTNEIPSYYGAVIEDCRDAVEDGVIVIAAASNDNVMVVPNVDPDTGTTHVDWDNYVRLTHNGYSYFHHQGSAPGAAPGCICVGAINNDINFKRATFSNYGPRIDVWAPGVSIVSSYNNAGTPDGKYGGAPNYYKNISGTSMATPQVAGVATCMATNKHRLSNDDIIGFIQQNAKIGDMTFNTWSGLATTRYYNMVAISNAEFQGYGSDVNGVYAGNNRNMVLWLGDTLEIWYGYNSTWTSVGAQTGHPLWIKTVAGTGTGNAVSNPAATNNGTTGGSTSTLITWTPTVAGTYYGQCEAHAAMVFEIKVLTPSNVVNDASGFMNPYCQKGSDNTSLISTNPRKASGYLSGWYQQTLRGRRNLDLPYENRQIYPRNNNYHRPA